MGIDVVGVVGTGFVVVEILMKVNDVCVGVSVDGCVIPCVGVDVDGSVGVDVVGVVGTGFVVVEIAVKVNDVVCI